MKTFKVGSACALLLIMTMFSGSIFGLKGATDLAITNIGKSVTVPMINDEIMFTVVVKNLGVQKSPATELKIKFDKVSNPSVHQIPSLQPGMVFKIQRNEKFSKEGQYLLKAKVDFDNKIPELDENNNEKEISFIVKQAPQSDLIISALKIKPATVDTSTEIELKASVKNAGKGSSLPSILEIKIAEEANPSKYNIPALLPESTYDVTRKKIITSAGAYKVLAKADSDGTVTESNEGNNEKIIDINVSESSRPDLFIETFRKGSTSLHDTREIVITAIVKNKGDAASKASKAQIRIGSAGDFVFNDDVPSLSPRSFTVLKHYVTLTEVKSYECKATADVNFQVNESDETNNSREMIFEIGEPDRPDLIIESFTKNISSVKKEDEVTFTAVIKNTGKVASEPCKANIKIGGELLNVERFDVPALQPNSTYTITRTSTFIHSSGYQCDAIVDVSSIIEESDESNNHNKLIFFVSDN